MNSKDLTKKIIISAAGGVVIFAAISIFSDFRELLRVMAGFNYWYLPVILFLAPLNYFFRFVKWNFYLRLINVRIRLKENIIIFFSGFSMTITPGKLGELLKTYILKQKYNIPMSTTAPLVFAERLTDAISMLLLSCVGFSAFNYGLPALIAITLMALIGILIIQNKNLCLSIIYWMGKISFLRQKSEQLHNFYESTYILFKWKNLLVAVGVGVVSWGFEGFAIYYTLLAMGKHIPTLASIFVISFSSIIGAVSMLPGGLFAAEGSIIGILLLMGIPKAMAAGTTIVVRFSTLWLGVVIGVFTLMIANRIGMLDQE